MGICTVCREETKYRCIRCQTFICNRSLDCHVPVDENSISGWRIGCQVAFCHPCNTISESAVQNGASQYGVKKFEIHCASRGFHVYREVWRPVLGEFLEMEQDYGNVHDPFSIAIKAVSRERLTNFEIVGHIPREISRFCHYFLNYGGALEGRVRIVKYRPSPIPNGGLEIPIFLIVKKGGSDDSVFEKMKQLVNEYYLEPDKIKTSSVQTEIEAMIDDVDDVDLEPFEPEEIEEVMEVIDETIDETPLHDDIIVIDD